MPPDSLVVFLGPTLPRSEAERELCATYLGPAAQGDVYRVARQRPFAIAIVDGYFERLPAVWHKEVLWALAAGIHVLGAASMGALRASELERFGMQGVGEIFEAFKSGKLEDDDEVAVAHADAGEGFLTASEAMVNIRATLNLAADRGVVSTRTRSELERIAKSTFYPDRAYPVLFARAAADGVSPEELAALRQFIAVERVDCKRADALLLLRTLRALAETRTPPPARAFTFAHTEAWQQVVSKLDRLTS